MFASLPLLYVTFASLNKTLKSDSYNHTHNRRTRQRHTHNLKSTTLLLIQSNSSTLPSSFFSSNPSSNRWRTHIQFNSAALHLFPYDLPTLLLFRSKSATPSSIFRFSFYVWLTLVWVYIISLNFLGLCYYCFVWVSVLIYLTN